MGKKINSLSTIAVTMGDPAGIGPELCLKIAADVNLRQICKLAIIGNAGLFSRVGKKCGLSVPDRVVSWRQWMDKSNSDDSVTIVDCSGSGSDATDGLLADADVLPGKIDAACGRAAFTYVENALEAAMRSRAAAVVTAPIHKESFARAGVPFPGHTEILAEKTGTKNFCMMLTSDEITVSLATTHIGLCEVAGQLNTQRISDVIRLTDAAMQRIRRRRPRLTVCGLNPHAGEHGLFGMGEEEKYISPAIETAIGDGIDVVGPLPPDTAFLPSIRRKTDAYVCMYHDQGLIPMKMLAFDTGVNVTLGLPIIRTSVDHGTGFDIAWTGKASPRSLQEAVRLAAILADGAETK